MITPPTLVSDYSSVCLYITHGTVTAGVLTSITGYRKTTSQINLDFHSANGATLGHFKTCLVILCSSVKCVVRYIALN